MNKYIGLTEQEQSSGGGESYDRGELNKSGYDRGELNNSGIETSAGAAMHGWPSTVQSENMSDKEVINYLNTYDSACLMLKLKFNEWGEILKMVKDEDCFKKETIPHVTIIYGLDPSISFERQIKPMLEKVREPIEIKCIGIGCFKNEDFDVLKFEIQSEFLDKFHELLKNTFPNEQRFSKYQPHITIAYLRKGLADNYLPKLQKMFKPSSFYCKDFEYTIPEKDPYIYKINKILEENNKPQKYHSDHNLLLGANPARKEGVKETFKRPKDLPQVTAPFNFVLSNLEDIGVQYNPVIKKVSELMPMQDELSLDKIKYFAGEFGKGNEHLPIFISDNNMICDGHHRAAGKVEVDGQDGEIKAIKLKLPEKEAKWVLRWIQDRFDLVKDDIAKEFLDENSLEEFDNYFKFGK